MPNNPTSRETTLPPSVVDHAKEWREQHFRHVYKLVHRAASAYPPTGSDAIRPELWKGAHWLWFETHEEPHHAK